MYSSATGEYSSTLGLQTSALFKQTCNSYEELILKLKPNYNE